MPIEQAIRVLARRKVLVASPDVRRRGETARSLRSVGATVTEADTVSSAADQIRATVPEVVVFDLDLPGDLHLLLQVISQPRNGAKVRGILTCRPRTPRDRLLSLLHHAADDRALGGILLTPCRPELIMERLAGLLDTPAADQPGKPVGDQPVSTVDGNSSLLQQSVLCPFHDDPVRTRRYALRSGRVAVEPDFFDVPVYTHAVANHDFVDYHNLCVTVCPKCLFASADPEHFISCVQRRQSFRPLPSTARYAIEARALERKRIVGDLPADFFSPTRSPQSAVKSLELALHCSQTLHHVARHYFTDELVRQGNYQLRLALLKQNLQAPQADRDGHIESASRLLRDAFTSLPETGLPRNVYQVVATSIYLNEDREAQQYLGQLTRFARTNIPNSLRASVDRYLSRTQRAWEDRNDHRRPAPSIRLPSTPAATPTPPSNTPTTTDLPAVVAPFVASAA